VRRGRKRDLGGLAHLRIGDDIEARLDKPFHDSAPIPWEAPVTMAVFACAFIAYLKNVVLFLETWDRTGWRRDSFCFDLATAQCGFWSL